MGTHQVNQFATSKVFDPNTAFFVMDSYNCVSAENHLFGYAVIDGEVIDSSDPHPVPVPPGHQGAYVSIAVADNTITITQDFIGCYGLYLYRDGGYFALSNSFARLVEHLSGTRPLSFNQQYAEEFFAGEIVPYSLRETPISEIELLWRNAVVIIDQQNRDLRIEYLDYGEDTLELDTKQGIEALDNWYTRWTSFIKELEASGHPLVIDLSGGFDSRLNLCLFLGSGVDMGNVQINSIDDDLHTHQSDFLVASEIANAFDLHLTPAKKLFQGKRNDDGRPIPPEESLLISLYAKGGFHKQMLFQTRQSCPQIYYFSGDGGEIFRDYWFMTVDDFLQKATKGLSRFASDERARYKKAIENAIRTSLSLVQEKFTQLGRPIYGKNLVRNLYRESRCRHHFGAIAVESYFGGKVKLSPLMDRKLSQLKSFTQTCEDARLMGAIILDRYQPHLLDIPLDSGRSIPENTIAEAKRINAKFPRPRRSPNADRLDIFKKRRDITPPRRTAGIPAVGENLSFDKDYDRIIEKDLYRSFLSDAVRCSVLNFLGTSAYDVALKTAGERRYFPCIYIEAALPLAAFRYLASPANIDYQLSLAKFVSQTQSSFIDVRAINQSLSSALHGYACGRIDLQCAGTSSILRVDTCSSTTFCNKPAWLLNGNNQGVVLQDYTGYLAAKIDVLEETLLAISLRGRDKRNGDTRIPIKVTFTSLKLDGLELLDSCQTVWHDDLFSINIPIAPGKSHLVEAEWVPCDLTI